MTIIIDASSITVLWNLLQNVIDNIYQISIHLTLNLPTNAVLCLFFKNGIIIS